MESTQPQTLQAAIRYFSDEHVCIDTVARLRWSDGKPTCPACGHQEHYYLKTQKRWKCKECHKQFSVKLGTIFEDSPIALEKWLTALWMLVSCRNGVSSYEVARTLGITQKSAWFVLHRLRFALRTGNLTKLGGGGTPVEVDETFIGGKARFMHRDKRERMSSRGGMQGGQGKAVVMGLLERGGKVKAAVIPHRRENLPEQIVREMVEPGAEVHTDEFSGYTNLQDGFTHKVINHLEGYVKENVHTNGIENFWSLLKRGLSGTYVSVEPFHLARYVDEQAFRFNNRKDDNGKKLSDAQRFELALSQVAGKRLTFAEVTGKVGETAF
jgi:transposase-like protein